VLKRILRTAARLTTGRLRRRPAGIHTPAKVSRNDNPSPVSDDEARALVAAAKWYHRFELRPGLVTPGVSEFPAAAVADFLGIPKDLTGRRALDIGAWDGPLSFELERRGAEVIALDIQDPERVGFGVARRVLGSRVPHIQASVYDLTRLNLGLFDHIVFKGVYYHLKYPILAFEQIAKALKVGGRVHFEGEGALNYVEDLDGRRVELDLKALAKLRVPLCLSYPNHFKGASNWFIPNPACMEAWLTACGLKLVSMQTWETDAPPHGGQRLIGVAEKHSDKVEELEHPLY
jgi:tRNA (mo5U34)-methyltransferase